MHLPNNCFLITKKKFQIKIEKNTFRGVGERSEDVNKPRRNKFPWRSLKIIGHMSKQKLSEYKTRYKPTREYNPLRSKSLILIIIKVITFPCHVHIGGRVMRKCHYSWNTGQSCCVLSLTFSVLLCVLLVSTGRF